jgi:putative phosphoesterase
LTASAKGPRTRGSKAHTTVAPPPHGPCSARPTATSATGTPKTGARIGVLSDSHGHFVPSILEIFAGVDHIIHAGDIMDPGIIAELETVAPVTAVAGNMDTGELGARLPCEASGDVQGVRFVVGHKRKRLLKRLAIGKIEGMRDGEMPDLVIYGHDHTPAAAWVEGTLYLDPGSASSPHDEDDGPTVAIVTGTPNGLAVSFLPLKRRDEEAS